MEHQNCGASMNMSTTKTSEGRSWTYNLQGMVRGTSTIRPKTAPSLSSLSKLAQYLLVVMPSSPLIVPAQLHPAAQQVLMDTERSDHPSGWPPCTDSGAHRSSCHRVRAWCHCTHSWHSGSAHIDLDMLCIALNFFIYTSATVMTIIALEKK